MLKRIEYKHNDTGSNTDDISQQDRGIQAARELIDSINHMTVSENDPFVVGFLTEIINHTHRTLQEDFVKVIVLPFIKHYGKKSEEGSYDARNKYTVEVMDKLYSYMALNEIHFFE